MSRSAGCHAVLVVKISAEECLVGQSIWLRWVDGIFSFNRSTTEIASVCLFFLSQHHTLVCDFKLLWSITGAMLSEINTVHKSCMWNWKRTWSSFRELYIFLTESYLSAWCSSVAEHCSKETNKHYCIFNQVTKCNFVSVYQRICSGVERYICLELNLRCDSSCNNGSQCVCILTLNKNLTKRRAKPLPVEETMYGLYRWQNTHSFGSENMVLFTINIEYFKLTNEIWSLSIRTHTFENENRKISSKPWQGFMDLWKFLVCSVSGRYDIHDEVKLNT